MIITRIDPDRLAVFTILKDRGDEPAAIMRAMKISRATFYRYQAEFRRTRIEAKAMAANA